MLLTRALPLLTAVALVATGCSSPATDPGPDADPAAATTPQAIISLSPSTTEMLYAVGAGENVVAVDDQSDYPPEVPVTDLSGYMPNLEAILAYAPDLVVTTDDNGDIVSGLERAGVEVLLLPAGDDLDDTYTQLEQVGAATGHEAEAAEVVAGMKAEVDEIVASVPRRDEPLTYFHELDDTYYTVTDDTFVGNAYSLLGLRSIATGGDPYPQLSEELIVDADPDLVFLADSQCCGVTPEKAAARAGWDGLTAVREGRVHVVDEDVASRWGPRIVDYLRTVADLVRDLPVRAPAPTDTPAP